MVNKKNLKSKYHATNMKVQLMDCDKLVFFWGFVGEGGINNGMGLNNAPHDSQ